jgi:hypothetical protein
MQQHRERTPIPWTKSDGGLAEFRRKLITHEIAGKGQAS